MLIKEDLCFLLPPLPPHFNVVVATKSIGQSNILNIEKGEGGIGMIQCNFIENEGKSTDYSKCMMSVSTIFVWDCRY